MILLEAARQALPWLEWGGDDSEVVSSVKSGTQVVTWPNGDGWIHVRVGQEITRYPSPQSVALRLRRDLVLRCDEMDAIAGLRPRAELESNLTALRERMRWVPVGERLPEDGVDVLAVSNSGVTDAYVLFDMDGLPDWRRGDYQIRGVTHWQPMPAAPEVQNG